MYKEWAAKVHGKCKWKRLQELVAQMLSKLPDHEYVVAAAWIAGVHPDGGKEIAALRQRYQKSKEAVEAEIQAELAKKQRIRELESSMCPEFLETKKIRHEEGVDYYAEVLIKDKTYICRNIADFGYAIYLKDVGMAFLKETWWLENGSQVTMADDEKLAVEYLRLKPPIYSGINM